VERLVVAFRRRIETEDELEAVAVFRDDPARDRDNTNGAIIVVMEAVRRPSA
jgi:hypothetical protein